MFRQLRLAGKPLKVRKPLSIWDNGMRLVYHAAAPTPLPAAPSTPSLQSHGYGAAVAQSLLEKTHEHVMRLYLGSEALPRPALLQTTRGSGDSPAPARETGMADQDMRTYKLIELVGTSPTSYAEATKNAVERAGETLRGLGWFEVTELRGLLENGAISEYQVTLKIGFRVLDHDQA
jgi:flavin-binding protein dodecin